MNYALRPEEFWNGFRNIRFRLPDRGIAKLSTSGWVPEPRFCSGMRSRRAGSHVESDGSSPPRNEIWMTTARAHR